MPIINPNLPLEITSKYSVLNNTFINVAKPDPKDFISVEIGDSKVPDTFIPQQKIMRWDNECNVSIRLLETENGNETVETIGDKIKWSKGNLEAHFYDIPDGEGAREFEIVLRKKPKTNVVHFSVVDKDVDYFYQPALTPEEIAEGASRPINVEGSYAVYAKTPKTNWTGGKEYKCGKIGHIFRPKIIDSVGTEVWGELNISKGILRVTIPQDFLDKAVYPVRHAAGLTFGYTSIGLNADSTGSILSGTLFTGAVGTGISISAGVAQNANTTEAARCAVFLHSDLSFVTNSRTEEKSIKITPKNWVVFNFETAPTFSAVDYVVSLWGNAANGYLYYDTGGTNQKHWKSSVTGYPTFPNPFTAGYSHFNERSSIYATYTAGGGAVSPNHLMRLMGCGNG